MMLNGGDDDILADAVDVIRVAKRAREDGVGEERAAKKQELDDAKEVDEVETDQMTGTIVSIRGWEFDASEDDLGGQVLWLEVVLLGEEAKWIRSDQLTQPQHLASVKDFWSKQAERVVTFTGMATRDDQNFIDGFHVEGDDEDAAIDLSLEELLSLNMPEWTIQVMEALHEKLGKQKERAATRMTEVIQASAKAAEQAKKRADDAISAARVAQLSAEDSLKNHRELLRDARWTADQANAAHDLDRTGFKMQLRHANEALTQLPGLEASINDLQAQLDKSKAALELARKALTDEQEPARLTAKCQRLLISIHAAEEELGLGLTPLKLPKPRHIDAYRTRLAHLKKVGTWLSEHKDKPRQFPTLQADSLFIINTAEQRLDCQLTQREDPPVCDYKRMLVILDKLKRRQAWLVEREQIWRRYEEGEVDEDFEWKAETGEEYVAQARAFEEEALREHCWLPGREDPKTATKAGAAFEAAQVRPSAPMVVTESATATDKVVDAGAATTQLTNGKADGMCCDASHSVEKSQGVLIGLSMAAEDPLNAAEITNAELTLDTAATRVGPKDAMFTKPELNRQQAHVEALPAGQDMASQILAAALECLEQNKVSPIER